MTGICLSVRQLLQSVHTKWLQHCMQDPTNSPLLEGRWRLLFTTRPGSASPIQKTFVGVDAFTVYQEVLLSSAEKARVNNIVDFGAKIGTLKASCFACCICNCMTPTAGHACHKCFCS